MVESLSEALKRGDKSLIGDHPGINLNTTYASYCFCQPYFLVRAASRQCSGLLIVFGTQTNRHQLHNMLPITQIAESII